MSVHPKLKPSPTAAGMFRVAINEGWAHEIFTDHDQSRFNAAMDAISSYLAGDISKAHAQAEVFSLMLDSTLDYFGDDIPEAEYNAAIMPGFLLKRQAS